MNYLNIANSNLLFIFVILVIIFVMVQSIIFFIKAWREGKRIGLSREIMLNAVKSSAAIMAIIGILIKKFKMRWLTNFALSIVF